MAQASTNPTVHPLFGQEPSCRPGRRSPRPPRAVSVKDGARSAPPRMGFILDGHEHGGRLGVPGREGRGYGERMIASEGIARHPEDEVIDDRFCIFFHNIDYANTERAPTSRLRPRGRPPPGDRKEEQGVQACARMAVTCFQRAHRTPCSVASDGRPTLGGPPPPCRAGYRKAASLQTAPLCPRACVEGSPGSIPAKSGGRGPRHRRSDGLSAMPVLMSACIPRLLVREAALQRRRSSPRPSDHSTSRAARHH
jgi:hypothetical protein